MRALASSLQRDLAPWTTLLALSLLALPLIAPLAVADEGPELAASWSAIKDDLEAGAVTQATATYEAVFAAEVARLDPVLATTIDAALDDAAVSEPGSIEATLARQVVGKGILHAATLAVEDALVAAGNVEAAEPWFALLQAKFGEKLDSAYLLLEEAEHDPALLPANREAILADLHGIFLGKVREEIEEMLLGWDDPVERQEKAIEGVAYYGPLRGRVAAELGAAAEEELHHELAELFEAAQAGDREAAEHAAAEARTILAQYEGTDLAAGGDALAPFLSTLDLLVLEYDEYVRDGEVVDDHGYEDEILALFLPALAERWAALEPTIRAADPAEAEEIAALVAALDTDVRSLAPNAGVAARAEHIEHELVEVLGEPLEPLHTGAGKAFEAGLAEMRAGLAEVLAAHEAGERDRAASLVQSLYLDTYGPKLETRILANDPTLNGKIEGLLNIRLKGQVQSGAPIEDVEATIAELDGHLVVAQEKVASPSHPAKLFADSLLIILREGFEAILVVAAVVLYLKRRGHEDKLKDIWIGVGAALAATLLLYLLVQTVFELSGANREILEGVTALLAVAVLFYVSYWLISKVEVAKWNRFIQGKVRDAISSGRTWALASVAFLAVFREGLETVLFYQGLFAASGGNGTPVVAGFVVGSLALVALALAFYKYGVKLPLRPFFIVTSALLYYLAFTFMGAGIHELQEAGVVGTTVIGPLATIFHDLPLIGTIAGLLGIYPTWETVLGQAVLAAAGIGGVVWTFHLEPRVRAPGSSVE